MDKTETFKDRLLFFIKYMNLTTKSFEQSIGVSNSYVANLRKRMGDDILNKTLLKYPRLNRMWLLTGDGKMLNSSSEISLISNSTNVGNTDTYRIDSSTLSYTQTANDNNKSQSVKDRLILFINYLKLTKSAFEQSIEVYNGFVNQVTNRTGVDKLRKILNKYPQLNKDWLLTGEGEMLNYSVYGGTPKTAIITPPSEEPSKCKVKEIPIIPQAACIEPNVDTLNFVKHNNVATSPIVHQFPSSDVW